MPASQISASNAAVNPPSSDKNFTSDLGGMKGGGVTLDISDYSSYFKNDEEVVCMTRHGKTCMHACTACGNLCPQSAEYLVKTTYQG